MIGQTILGYTVMEKIGSGGFATVYRVEKQNPSGVYTRALKHISFPTEQRYQSVLNSMNGDYEQADAYFTKTISSFFHEIEIMDSFSREGVKNIVAYYENDIQKQDSPRHYDVYILMELLTSLPKYLNTHSFTVREVFRLAYDVLSALETCHERNIIHRDIKGDNIFVGDGEIFKIGDFGVSRMLDSTTHVKSIKGTPNYIAPEVHMGKPYDKSVDFYSLGIVLYRLLNDFRNPFMPVFPAAYTSEDEDRAFDCRMKGEKPPLPRNAQNPLGEVVIKALLPAGERYNSAQEFREALKQAETELSDMELSRVVRECSGQSRRDTFPLNSKSGLQYSDNDMISQQSREEESMAKTPPSGGINEETQNQPASVPTSMQQTLGESHARNATYGIVNTYSDNTEEASEENSNQGLFQTMGDVAAEPSEYRPVFPKSRESFSPERTVPPQPPRPAPVQVVRKESFSWVPYGMPLILIGVYLLLFHVIFPLTLYRQEISVTGVLSAIVLLAILRWGMIAGFIVSLFILGRKLHFKKARYADNAILRDRQAYVQAQRLLDEIETIPESDPAWEAMRTVTEHLRNESDFGIGQPQAIQYEQEIAALLHQIEEMIPKLQNAETHNTAVENIRLCCTKIIKRLKLRTEANRQQRR